MKQRHGSWGTRSSVSSDGYQLWISVTFGLVLSFLLLPVFADTAFAAPGDLDLTFDSDGKVVSSISSDWDQGNALAVQPDGKFLVAGNSSYHSAVARYNPDGSLDDSFDDDGKTLPSFSQASDIALQSDGKVVVGGESYGYDASDNGSWNFAIARYNSDGSLDNNFGAGEITTDFGGNESVSALAIQPDGKILSMGASFDQEYSVSSLVVARYNLDGGLDTTFGAGGKVKTNLGTKSYAGNLAVQPDGKIIVASSSGDDTNSSFALVRYNANGSLDTSFGSSGKVTTSFGAGQNHTSGLTIQSDGKLIAVGYTENRGFANTENHAVARYNPNGTLDTSFSGDGKLTTDFGGYDYASDVVIQPDGKIVTAGTGRSGDGEHNEDFALVRYNPNGTLDSTLASEGKLTNGFGPDSPDYGRALALLPDGKIVVAGSSGHHNAVTGGFSYNFAIARYHGATDMASDPVTGFATTVTDGRAQLSWTNPTASDFGATRILRSAVGYATSPYSNTNQYEQKEVYEGTATTYEDTGLANGTTYYYTAFSRDMAGDWSVTAAKASVTPRVPPPSAKVTSGPSGFVKRDYATFSFASSQGSSFQCSLDGGPYSECGSPRTYFNLPDGSHLFRVRATDVPGNNTPAERRWVVDTIRPSISYPSPKPNAKTKDRTPTLQATIRDSRSNLTKNNIALYLDGRRSSTNTFSYATSTDRLRYTSGKIPLGSHKVKIVARDAAGNAATRSWSFRIIK